jgi:hypothetical protein
MQLIILNFHGIWRKYRTREGLKLLIERIKNGVPNQEITDCYPGISDDIDEMILSGEIIACKNKEMKDRILYPRGMVFLASLSGTVHATPCEQHITTTDDLRKEIRRGDAIRIGGEGLKGTSWYRVSSAISSTKSQPGRARPPLSVSSLIDLSDRNTYVDNFNNDCLPLDGEYDGDYDYTGKAYKFGCTNDIREKWAETVHAIKTFKSEKELLDEVTKLGLVSNIGTLSGAKRHNRDATKKKPRKKAKRRFQRITNLHLQDSLLSRELDEAEEEAGQGWGREGGADNNNNNNNHSWFYFLFFSRERI